MQRLFSSTRARDMEIRVKNSKHPATRDVIEAEAAEAAGEAGADRYQVDVHDEFRKRLKRWPSKMILVFLRFHS
jgi:hypothetical protein